MKTKSVTKVVNKKENCSLTFTATIVLCCMIALIFFALGAGVVYYLMQ